MDALSDLVPDDTAALEITIGAPEPAWETKSDPAEGGSILLYGPPNSGQAETIGQWARDRRTKAQRLMVVVSGLPASRSLYNTLNHLDADLNVVELARQRSRKAGPVLGARADIVIVTPEVLHRDVLPDRYRFGAMLESLAEVCIWDLTSMRGLLGSHLHHILARLENAMRADFGLGLAYSATASELGEPERLFESLIGRSARRSEVARHDPAEVLVTMIDPVRMPDYKAPATIASRVAATAALLGERVLVLTQSRLQSELIAGYVLEHAPDELEGKVITYRAGYLDETRTDLEQMIESGASRVVVATSALAEDVGGFDVVVQVGFPGVLSRFRRDLARITGAVGLGVFIAEPDLLDSWMTAHAAELGTRPNERAAINPWNREVLMHELACATAESSVDPQVWSKGDSETATRLSAALAELEKARLVAPTPAGYVYTGSVQPQRNKSLRGRQHRRYLLITNSGEVLEELDEERITTSCYLGAVYRHRGGRYLITGIDEHSGTVIAEELQEPVHTKVLTESQYHFYEPQELGAPSKDIQAGTSKLAVVEMHVGHEVVGDDGIIRGVVESRLPPQTLETDALFIVFGGSIEAAMDQERLPGALHALEHTAIGVLGLIAICDRWDVGGVSSPAVGAMMPSIPLGIREPKGLVAIYDGAQGGSGIASLSFDRLGDLARATLSVLESCPCESGCPSCIVSPKCGNNNEPLSKAGALLLGRALVAALDPSASGSGS